MNTASVVIALLMAVAIVLALRVAIRDRKSGGCGCGCNGCAKSATCSAVRYDQLIDAAMAKEQ